MQIPPSHHLLHALGSTPSPPEPVRSATAMVTPEPVAPGRNAAQPLPRPPQPAGALAADSATAGGPPAALAPNRPGVRVDMLV